MDCFFLKKVYQKTSISSLSFHFLLLLSRCCLLSALPLLAFLLFLRCLSISLVHIQYYPYYKAVPRAFYSLSASKSLVTATVADIALYKCAMWFLIGLVMFITGFLLRYYWYLDNPVTSIYLQSHETILLTRITFKEITL